MSSVIAIHQPNYLPWPGFFYKLKSCDKFIILDTVNIEKGRSSSITNRTHIKATHGEQILTVPIRKGNSKLIRDIAIDNSRPWRNKHLKSIFSAYNKSKEFHDIYALLEKLISQPFEKLIDLNYVGIKYICEYLKIETPLFKASDLPVKEEDRNLRLALLCKHLGGDIYLSGEGGRKYNNEELFKANGVTVKYTDYKQPPYAQLHGDFIGGLSIIDALFNLGKGAGDLFI